jgi:TRAP-type C4-dicarboxylate transport system permease small subunit
MRSMLHLLNRLHQAVTTASFALACAALVLFTAVFNMEVARRYFFNAPSSWSQDVISVAALCVTFLALPYITMKRKHVSIDIMMQKLGPAGRRRMITAVMIVAALLLFAITWITGQEAFKQWMRGTQTASSIAIPKWPFLAIMTWGFLSAGIHALVGAFAPEETAE